MKMFGLLLLLGIGVCVNAQTVYQGSAILSIVKQVEHKPKLYQNSLRGKVVDEQGKPVVGLVVSIKELGISTVTNAQGSYAFCNFDKGMYTIEFSDTKQTKTLSNVNMPNYLVYNLMW